MPIWFILAFLLMNGVPFGLVFGLLYGSARVGLAAWIMCGSAMTIFLMSFRDFAQHRKSRAEKSVGAEILLKRDGFVSLGRNEDGQIRFGAPLVVGVFFTRDMVVLIAGKWRRNLPYDMLGRDMDSLKDGADITVELPDEVFKVVIVGENGRNYHYPEP